MRLLSVIFFVVFSVCGNVLGQTHSIQLEKDKDFFQTVENINMFTASADEETDTIKTQTAYTLKFRVTESDSDGYILQACFQNMRLVNMHPDGTYEYIPEKASAYDLVSSIMANILNQNFYVHLSKNGSVLEINNLNEVFRGGIKNLPEDMTSQFVEMFVSFYGSEILSRNIEVMTKPLPLRLNNNDNKWTINQSLISIPMEEIEVGYNLVNFSPDTYNIEGFGEKDKKRHKFDENDSDAKAISNFSFSVQASINKSTGWFRHGMVTEEVEGRLKVSGDSELKGWIPFQMFTKTTITGSN